MAQVIYVPGAEPPVNDGERRVIGYLQLHLPDEYALYPGVQIIHQGRADDVDVLILTPHALVVAEVKDIAGHLAIDNNACYVDDNLRPQPFNVTNAKARRLKSRLKEWDPRLRDLWVSPLVILARKPASLHLVPKSLHEDVMVVEESIAKLTDPSRILPGPPYQELGELGDATKEALNLTRGREADVSFGAYRCTKLLDRTAEEDLWAATHSVTGEEVEIRHVGRNPMSRAARIAEAEGEVEAFGLLRDQPWIDGPREMIPQDDGTLALVFSERRGITLADTVASGEEIKAEQVILDLVSAIDAAHSIGAIHGRLSPRWIELQPDLSRIRGFTSKGGVAPTKLIEDDREFLAPEAVGRQKPVGAPADIFSLGRIIELLDPDQHSLQALGEELANPDVSRRRVPAGYIRRAIASLFGVTADEETTTTRIEFDEAGRVETGSVIGSYVVADFLGSGGFSQVYSARHALGGPTRALKLFHGEEARDMVAHEFNVLQNLEDPHVVEVIGAGEWDDGWFMVSEYLEGETLAQRIDAFDGQTDVGEATLIGFELLDALVSIHEQGVTHRDVKPDNVILVEDRGAVLFDFGVAASSEEQVAGLTWQYWPPGLPAGSTTPDSDLFATGVMLCELVTGEHPYPNRNPHAGDEPDLSKVPPALREVVAQAIDPDHEHRFASAGEFREQLEPFVDQRREVTVSRRDLYRRVERLISMGQLDKAEELCLPEWKRLAARIDRKRQAQTASDTDFFHGLRIRFAGTETARVYRLDNSGPVDAQTWLYQVTGKPGLMLDVRVAEDDEGERQIATVDAFDSPEKFKQLENRLRHGIREEGDHYVMRLRYTKRPDEGLPTQRQTSLEELGEDAGVDVRETLLDAGAIDVGRREDLGLHEPRRSRNEVAVLIPEESRNEIALRAYLLTTVVPLARDANLLLQDS